MGDTRECEEAIFKVTRETGPVPEKFDRLSLGVQHSLYSLDDVIAMGQEEVEEFDVGLKRCARHATDIMTHVAHDGSAFSQPTVRAIYRRRRVPGANVVALAELPD